MFLRISPVPAFGWEGRLFFSGKMRFEFVLPDGGRFAFYNVRLTNWDGRSCACPACGRSTHFVQKNAGCAHANEFI